MLREPQDVVADTVRRLDAENIRIAGLELRRPTRWFMIHDPVRPTPAQAAGNVAVTIQRELLATVRQPTLPVLVFVQPLMLILMFRYVFGGAIRTPNGSYVNYLVPVLVLTAVFGSSVTCIGLSQNLACGMIDRLRSLPMAPSAVLVGRTLSDLVRNVASLAVMFAVAVLIGFCPDQGVLRVVGAMALLLGFSYMFSWSGSSLSPLPARR